MASDFALDLIVAEESRREPAEGESTDGGAQSVAREPPSLPEDSPNMVIEYESVTANREFHLRDNDNAFPVRGPGTLENLVIIAESTDFDIAVYVDNGYFVNDDFSTLQVITTELASIAAYEDPDGRYVFGVSDIEFSDQIDVVFTPHTSMNIVRYRAEVSRGRFATTE